MAIRTATPEDAEAIQAIYAPIVENTAISFELEVPTVDEMRQRIGKTLASLPWLVDAEGDTVNAYAYASRHRERAAYQWAVDTTIYVDDGCRRSGVGKRLYAALLKELASLGYFQAFAGIALPNDASVGLHESMGFRAVGVYRHVGFKFGAWHDVGWWQRSLQPLTTPEPPRLFKS